MTWMRHNVKFKRNQPKILNHQIVYFGKLQPVRNEWLVHKMQFTREKIGIFGIIRHFDEIKCVNVPFYITWPKRDNPVLSWTIQPETGIRAPKPVQGLGGPWTVEMFDFFEFIFNKQIDHFLARTAKKSWNGLKGQMRRSRKVKTNHLNLVKLIQNWFETRSTGLYLNQTDFHTLKTFLTFHNQSKNCSKIEFTPKCSIFL